MRLLLDTHVLMALIEEQQHRLNQIMRLALTTAESELYASVASLWEIAIKVRLGKLAMGPAPELLAGFIERMGIQIIDINRYHVLAVVEPVPATRDPFDRLLLAQCMVENLRLVTSDRALTAHPLVWRQE
jgi:PIN domain nuclease of toxin-antitoxin system